jgi:hypothetical protein
LVPVFWELLWRKPETTLRGTHFANWISYDPTRIVGDRQNSVSDRWTRIISSNTEQKNRLFMFFWWNMWFMTSIRG